jgi:hypothetical protein
MRLCWGQEQRGRLRLQRLPLLEPKTLAIEQYGSIGGVLALGQPLLGTSDAECYMALGEIGGEFFSRLIRSDGGSVTSLASC